MIKLIRDEYNKNGMKFIGKMLNDFQEQHLNDEDDIVDNFDVSDAADMKFLVKGSGKKRTRRRNKRMAGGEDPTENLMLYVRMNQQGNK